MTGATSVESGYYKADVREVQFALSVSASRLQFQQTASGGSTTEPGFAYLNEFDGGKNGGAVTATYDYTYNGVAGRNPNISSITQGTTVKSFSYDHLNRLSGFIQTVGGPSTIDESYLYPAYGERLAKINNKSASNNEEWEFAFGDNPAVYYTKSTGGSYSLDSEMVPGNGIDDRWARIKADGTDLFYIPDPLGGAHRVINGSQAILNTVLTTAYGVKHPTFTETNTQPDPFGFAGMRKDGGSLHCRARAYLPDIGRFAQPDPLRFGGGDPNLYAYVRNNPVSLFDPFGLEVWSDKRMDSQGTGAMSLQDAFDTYAHHWNLRRGASDSGQIRYIQMYEQLAYARLRELTQGGGNVGDARLSGFESGLEMGIENVQKMYPRMLDDMEKGIKLFATEPGKAGVALLTAPLQLPVGYLWNLGKGIYYAATGNVQGADAASQNMAKASAGFSLVLAGQGIGNVVASGCPPLALASGGTAGGLSLAGAIGGTVAAFPGGLAMAMSAENPPQYKKPKPRPSGKEAATDIPSWAKGKRPLVNEDGKSFATRLMDEKYGAGQYEKGSSGEWSQLKKYGDRAFE